MAHAAFHALAEPRRRAILRLIRDEPRSVNEIAEHFDITHQAVSQHLRVLKDGGLVVSRAEGTRRVYQLNPDGVTALRAYLDRVWEDALTAFQKAADNASGEAEPEPEPEQESQ